MARTDPIPFLTLSLIGGHTTSSDQQRRRVVPVQVGGDEVAVFTFVSKFVECWEKSMVMPAPNSNQRCQNEVKFEGNNSPTNPCSFP